MPSSYSEEHVHSTTSYEPEPKFERHDAQPEAKQTLIQSFRKNPRLSLWGVAITSAALLMGYEMVFIGSIATLPTFKEAFGEKADDNDKTDDEYLIPALWLSLWAISHPLGASLGSLLAGWGQDRFGRRPTLGIATVWQAASITICFLADTGKTTVSRDALYFAGKVVQGLGVGAIMSTLQTYVSEVLPPASKGSIQSLIAPFTLVGQLLGSVVIRTGLKIAGKNSYRIPMSGQWVLSVIPVLLTVFLPESPVWLLQRGRREAAAASCRRLEGSKRTFGNSLIYRLQYDTSQREMEINATENISYLDLFRKRIDARRSLIIVFISLVPQLFGLPLLGHASYVLEVMSMDPKKATTFLIGGIAAGLATTFAAFVLLSKFGRRPLLILSLAVVALIWASIGIVSCLHTNTNTGIVYTGVGMILVIVVSGLGAWPLSYAIAGETSSLRLRARSQGLSWFVNTISNALLSGVLPFLYNPDAANLKGKLGFISLACLLPRL